MESNRKEVKVWDSYDDYNNEWLTEREERRSKWYNKVKDFFVYRIGWRTRDWWYDTKWYFRNRSKFLKLAKVWRPWDYHYQIELFTFGLGELANYIDQRGHEVDISRNKKVAAIRELIAEINRDYEDEIYKKFNRHDSFRNDVEKITEYNDGSVCYSFKEDEETKKINNDYFHALDEERENHYNKIFKLIIGQDRNKLKYDTDAKMDELGIKKEDDLHMTKNYEIYSQLFDGSGIEGWWD